MDSSITEKSDDRIPAGTLEKTPSNVSIEDQRIVTKDGNEKLDGTSIPSVEEDALSDDNVVVSTADDLVTHIIKVEDDPSISPWTFRMVFLGMNPNELHQLKSKDST